MAKKMGITTIQLYEGTRKRLEGKKLHPRESFDTVIKRLLEEDKFPTLEEMFKRSDKLKQSRNYTTEEIVEMTDEFDD